MTMMLSFFSARLRCHAVRQTKYLFYFIACLPRITRRPTCAWPFPTSSHRQQLQASSARRCICRAQFRIRRRNIGRRRRHQNFIFRCVQIIESLNYWWNGMYSPKNRPKYASIINRIHCADVSGMCLCAQNNISTKWKSYCVYLCSVYCVRNVFTSSHSMATAPFTLPPPPPHTHIGCAHKSLLSVV